MSDTVGNIATLTDGRNSNQKQCFRYDALERLTQATTYNDPGQGCTGQVGEANYHRTYTYHPNGNIAYRSDVGSYSYGSSKPHAVTAVGGGVKFRPKWATRFRPKWSKHRMTVDENSCSIVVNVPTIL